MPIRVYYEVLNQKGTPALYSDNYASRPAAGYQGRIFYSPDTAQIFYDTGSTWTLLADAGVGSGSLASVCANGNTTATGISITAGGLSTNSLTSTNLTAGSIPFIGTGGLFSQDNTNLFWDNTNKYFGINTNTPGTYLDVHGTNNVLLQINNTTTADSKIAFLQAGAGKWRIGNLYSGGTNLFHIYNNAAISLAMQIDSSNAALFYGSLSSNSYISAASGITLTNGGTTTTAGATNIGGLTAGLSIALASGFNQTLTFPTGVAYTYTFPSATGTLALTSNLSSYLPLTGGTLTGGLTINNALYINPTNTGLTGLDVASDTISFRSDNLEGSKRQLLMSMGSGTLISLTAKGYDAARITDIGFYTSSASGINSSPAIYLTGGNKVGIGTGTPGTIFSINDSNGIPINFGDISASITGQTAAYIGVSTSAYSGNNGDLVLYPRTSVSSNILLMGQYIGINTTTPGFQLSMKINGSQNSLIAFYNADNTNNSYIGIPYSAGSVISTSTTADLCLRNELGNILFAISNVQKMKLDNTGYLSVEGNGNGWTIGQASGVNRIDYTSSTFRCLSSANSFTPIAASAFNVNSDYRLKEDLKDFTNELDLINSIKIYDFKWKDREERNFGVLAHELQSIVPYVVYGEKDAINENGEQITQGVDYGKLVPITIKAIQNLDKRLTALENLN